MNYRQLNQPSGFPVDAAGSGAEFELSSATLPPPGRRFMNKIPTGHTSQQIIGNQAGFAVPVHLAENRYVNPA